MLIVDASTNPPHLLGVDSNRSRQQEISGFFVSVVVIDDPTKILPHRNFGRSTSGFSEKRIDETVHQMKTLSMDKSPFLGCLVVGLTSG
jgi:hypothetical protein